MNKKLLKLAKMVLALAETATDKAILIHEGELAVGLEVFVEDENGELQPAEDGKYETEKQVITVEEGKVAAIEDKEEIAEDPDKQPDAEPQLPTPRIDPNDIPFPKPGDNPFNPHLSEEEEARIAELEAELEAKNAELAEKDARIAELEAELDDLKAKLAESDARSAEEELKMNKQQKTTNGGIKFDLFNK